MKYIETKEFLEKSEFVRVVDVRSPAEFTQGHIPGAVNIPMFSNEERAIVGTNYKKEGRKTAIRRGFGFVGPKMVSFIDEAYRLCKDDKMLIHCWRGGMRSESMAWLFETAGLNCEVLKGGYKEYRKYIRETILDEKRIIVLGGLTGSGKTILLHEMSRMGEPVVDLEGLANHKGSAFGGIGQKDQPTTEQFENCLFTEVKKIRKKYFWVEDESLQIGKVFIPEEFYSAMLESITIFIDVPLQHRIDILVADYADQDKGLLEEAIIKLKKKLGNQAAREAIDALYSGRTGETAKILLNYYDKTYRYGLSKRRTDNVHRLDLLKEGKESFPQLIIEEKNKILRKILS